MLQNHAAVSSGGLGYNSNRECLSFCVDHGANEVEGGVNARNARTLTFYVSLSAKLSWLTLSSVLFWLTIPLGNHGGDE